jgi:hypothetical protein
MESPSTSETPAQETVGAKATGGKQKASGTTKRKRWRQNLILLAISLCVALLIGEWALRRVLFHSGDDFKHLKNPGNYYNEWDADYWKLIYRWDTTNPPPKHPHPYLGWTRSIDPETYTHRDLVHVGRRRPVLLYGDSFSMCIDSVQCFEDFLNADTAFNKANYFLNYGVGGYGVCQASLLCRKTVTHFQKPLVVFGLLTSDMDRTVLPVRTGLKPYYDIEDGRLTLKGLPITGDNAQYFEDHPIATTSLLLRRYLSSKFNILPEAFKSWYENKDRSIAHILAVNGMLIKALAAELRAMEIDFVFLVFHYEDNMLLPESDNAWRDAFLKKTLTENKIPFIWSKDLIRAHQKAHPQYPFGAYIIPGEGHPTSMCNGLIADEIKRIALAQPRPADFVIDTLDLELYTNRIRQRQLPILKDSTAYADAIAKAQANGIPVDSQIVLEAAFLMNMELEAEGPFKADSVFEGKWRFE